MFNAELRYDYNGQSKTLANWAATFGMPKEYLYHRVEVLGMSFAEAIEPYVIPTLKIGIGGPAPTEVSEYVEYTRHFLRQLSAPPEFADELTLMAEIVHWELEVSRLKWMTTLPQTFEERHAAEGEYHAAMVKKHDAYTRLHTLRKSFGEKKHG